MKKFFLLIILLSSELFSSTIIGNPDVEVNSEGLYLIQIKLTSTMDITEDDIFITNFKSDEELSDLNFEFKIFENLQDYKRLTLAIPKDYSEDYISFRLDIKKELKKDIFIFLPQNNFVGKEKAQVSFKLPAKKISDEMTMVLSLDEETSEKIYHIQLKRFIDAQRIRTSYNSDKPMMRAELKKLQNRLWGKLNAVLGEDKMKSWSAHKKSI